MGDMYSLFLFVAMMGTSVMAATTLVDVTGPGCDQLDGYYLKKIDDYITIYAYPQYNTIATRDHCDVTVRADDGRRIEYIIENIIFNECGVEIKMYDNPTIDTNPIKIITCSDNSKVPIQGKTSYNVFRLRVRKTTPESRAFTFSMRLKNDLGPSMDFEKDAAKYTGEILEPSVIVGIAVAGGVVVIAVVGLAVFFCIRARSRYVNKQRYAADDKSSDYHSSKIGVSTSESQKRYSHPANLHPANSHQTHSHPTNSHQTHSYPTNSHQTHSHPTNSISHHVSMNQWNEPESRPPRRMRPPVPMPTQPSQRDPGRKSLSDRHRSGEHAANQSSQTRHTGRRDRETFA